MTQVEKYLHRLIRLQPDGKHELVVVDDPVVVWKIIAQGGEGFHRIISRNIDVNLVEPGILQDDVRVHRRSTNECEMNPVIVLRYS